MLGLGEISFAIFPGIEMYFWKNAIHQAYGTAGPLLLLSPGKSINEYGLDVAMDV